MMEGRDSADVGAPAASTNRLAYGLVRWQVELQLSRASALENRLGNTFTLSAAMIALLGSALLFAGDGTSPAFESSILVTAGLFVANVVTATLAVVVSRWSIAPDLNELMSNVLQYDEDAVLDWGHRGFGRGGRAQRAVASDPGATGVSDDSAHRGDPGFYRCGCDEVVVA